MEIDFPEGQTDNSQDSVPVRKEYRFDYVETLRDELSELRASIAEIESSIQSFIAARQELRDDRAALRSELMDERAEIKALKALRKDAILNSRVSVLEKRLKILEENDNLDSKRADTIKSRLAVLERKLDKLNFSSLEKPTDLSLREINKAIQENRQDIASLKHKIGLKWAATWDVNSEIRELKEQKSGSNSKIDGLDDEIESSKALAKVVGDSRAPVAQPAPVSPPADEPAIVAEETPVNKADEPVDDSETPPSSQEPASLLPEKDPVAEQAAEAATPPASPEPSAVPPADEPAKADTFASPVAGAGEAPSPQNATPTEPPQKASQTLAEPAAADSGAKPDTAVVGGYLATDVNGEAPSFSLTSGVLGGFEIVDGETPPENAVVPDQEADGGVDVVVDAAAETPDVASKENAPEPEEQMAATSGVEVGQAADSQDDVEDGGQGDEKNSDDIVSDSLAGAASEPEPASREDAPTPDPTPVHEDDPEPATIDEPVQRTDGVAAPLGGAVAVISDDPATEPSAAGEPAEEQSIVPVAENTEKSTPDEDPYPALNAADVDPDGEVPVVSESTAPSFSKSDLQIVISYGQSISAGDTQQAPISITSHKSGSVLEAFSNGDVADFTAAGKSEQPIIGALNRIAENFAADGADAPTLIGADLSLGGRTIVELLLGSDDEFASKQEGMANTDRGDFFYVSAGYTNSNGQEIYNVFMNDGHEGGLILANRSLLGQFDQIENSLRTIQKFAAENGLNILDNLFFTWTQGQSESGAYISFELDVNGNGKANTGDLIYHSRSYSSVLKELVEKVDAAADEILQKDLQVQSIIGQQAGNPREDQISYVARTDNTFLGALENTYQREHPDGVNYVDGTLRDNDTTHLNSVGYNLLGQDTGQKIYEIMTGARHEDEFMYLDQVFVAGKKITAKFANVQGKLVVDTSDFDGKLNVANNGLLTDLGFYILGRSTIHVESAEITGGDEVTITLNDYLTSNNFTLAISPNNVIRDDGVSYQAQNLFDTPQLEGETLPQYIPAQSVVIDRYGLVKDLHDQGVSQARNTVNGSDTADQLDGTSNSDVVLGKDGDDTITAGAGNDVIFGGAGADRIVFEDDGDTAHLMDFNPDGGDVIDISALFDGATPSVDQIANFVRLEMNDAGVAFLSVDADGSGDAFKPLVSIQRLDKAETLESMIENGSLFIGDDLPAPAAERDAEQDVAAVSGPLTKTEFVSEITHEATGVTYYFDEPVEVGHYWNGDPFVVNNGKDITIIRISPESNALAEGRVLNGAQVQPDATHSHGFDSVSLTNMNYRDDLNKDPGNTGNPIKIAIADYPGGASIVKAVSLENLEETRDRSSIEQFSVLTVVDEVPPEGAFRPPVQGADKTSHYSLSDLDFDKLQSVQRVEGQRDIEEFSLYSKATFVSWVSGSEGPRAIHPNKYHDGYGDYQMDILIDGFMALHSDYSNAEKQELYAAYVQLGLDYAGAVDNGVKWIADGGHNNAIKPFVVLAGVALNSGEIAQLADPSLHAYSEDKQFFYVGEDLVGKELFNFVGNKNPQIGNEYQDTHIGLPEWRVANDGREDPDLEAAYRWHNADNSPITALVIEMLGDGEGRQVWNSEAYFDYADRINHIFRNDERSGAHSPEDAWLNFVEAYAGQYSTQTDWTGPPEQVQRVTVKPNGAGFNVEIGGHQHDNGSEITRIDFRYSVNRKDWITLEGVDESFVVANLPENTLFYYQARYVNDHGEGAWSGNSFFGNNYTIVDKLLLEGYISESDIINNGGEIRQYVKTSHYQNALREIISGPGDEYADLANTMVQNTVITRAGMTLESGSVFIKENVQQGALVGTLLSTNEDGEPLSYELVSGNEYFAVNGYDLVTAGKIDFESQSSHKLTFNVSDGSETYQEEVDIFVTNVNEPVEDFTIDIETIKSNTPIGAVVGTFSAYDDDGTPIRYISNPNTRLDDAIFKKYFWIAGDEIVVRSRIDAEIAPSQLELRFIAQSGGENYGNVLTKVNIVSVDNVISSADFQSQEMPVLIGTDYLDDFHIALTSLETGVSIQGFDRAAGDILDIGDLLLNYDRDTDALTDFVRLSNVDGDSVISVDVDGGADGFIDAVTLIDTPLADDLDILVEAGSIEIFV